MFGFGRKKTGPPPAHEPADDAPGWDAIDRVLEAAFPGQEPKHWGAIGPPGQGLTGASAYRDGDVWLYVSYGLSDLFGTFPPLEDVDEPISGWGFELTMRLKNGDETPPMWPTFMLGNLAKYVYDSGNIFLPGHRVDGREPITGGDPPTRLTAIALAADPVFPTITSPYGRVEFITFIGVTAEENARQKAEGSQPLLDEFARSDPRLVTDITR